MLVRAWVSVFFLFLTPVPLVLSCIHALPASLGSVLAYLCVPLSLPPSPPRSSPATASCWFWFLPSVLPGAPGPSSPTL